MSKIAEAQKITCTKITTFTVIDLKLTMTHRFTPEIQESVPFSPWRGAPIGGIWIFPMIKITVIHKAHISPASTVVWA